MASVLSLIVIVTLSALLTRFASKALIHTGLSRQAARFQARSAFTGVGFTTREAERIVGHPVRRRIIMTLMLLGNVGVISILASLVLTFVGDEGETLAIVEKIGVLAGAFLLLFLLSKSKWVDRLISRWIDHLLDKYTDIKIRDFAGILHLSGEYEITEMLVEKDHWMGSKKLGKLNLRQEGLNLIGIERSDGTYLGMPDGSTTIYEGDTLILYGRESALKRLNQRRKGRKGAMERRKAIAENQKVEQDEKMADEKAMAETDT